MKIECVINGVLMTLKVISEYSTVKARESIPSNPVRYVNYKGSDIPMELHGESWICPLPKSEIEKIDQEHMERQAKSKMFDKLNEMYDKGVLKDNFKIIDSVNKGDRVEFTIEGDQSFFDNMGDIFDNEEWK